MRALPTDGVRRLVILVTVLLLAGCSPASPAPLVAPTISAARPVGLIAIGHSALTGEGTAGLFEDNRIDSWATGSDPAVNSVYLRLVAARPETEGAVANTARGGAVAGELDRQATLALATVPAPALVIIETIDNDIECNTANLANFGLAVAAALRTIHETSPNSKVLVVGQMGRPSVAFIKDLVAKVPSQKQALTWDDDCTFFDASGNLHERGFEKLTAAIDAYEAEEARVCATVPNCSTDGGVRKQWIDRIEYFSPDYAHLNVKGQAAEAEQIWPVVEGVLGQ